MPNVIRKPIEPEYTKPNGMYVQNLDRDDLEFTATERHVVYIPPGQFGGNHAHARTEAFIGYGKGLEIHWLDETGTAHMTRMDQGSDPALFIVPPQTPHAIKNNSDTLPGVVIEYADAPQSLEDVTRIQIVN